jgi:glycosyltransferase involved in cell wall biosynthesis
VLGPRLAKRSGVGLFSDLLIDSIEKQNFDVQRYYFKGAIRSVRRYIDQYFWAPIQLVRNVNRGDLVVLYQEDVAFLAFFARLRTNKVLVIVHHMPEVVRGAQPIDRMKALILRLNLHALVAARIVMCPSETTAKLVTQCAPRASVRIIENSFKFPDTVLDKHEARKSLESLVGRSMANKFVLLIVGSEETRKNVAVLIDGLMSLERFDEILFLKLGRPISQVNRKVHEEKLKSAGVDYVLMDEVSDDILQLAYSAADLFVSPSLMEGFGRTPIEAQGAGMPVCASALAVFDETMRKTYFSVERPEDPASWTRAIDELMKNDDLRATLAREGADNARRYDISIVGEKFATLLADLANE